MVKKINAVVILGGGLVKDKNGWRTTKFNEGDNFGGLGDNLRVAAGFFLYKDFYKSISDLMVAVLGGRGQLKDVPDAPTVASVLKRELIKFGIPADKILEEDQSGNTYQQLKELQKLILDKGWDDISVISNQYHLPRVSAMIECGEELKELRQMLAIGKINLLAAEKILVDYDAINWKDYIKKAYADESMKRRVELEQKGVADIKSGAYKL